MTVETMMAAYAAAGGALNGAELERLGQAVWQRMLSQSRGRVRTVEEHTPEGRLVQDCFRAMVEDWAEDRSGTVASETLGQWSRTYRDEGRTRDQRQNAILREYLGETGLLYRGV